jgi:hypothetical protein
MTVFMHMLAYLGEHLHVEVIIVLRAPGTNDCCDLGNIHAVRDSANASILALVDKRSKAVKAKRRE